MATFWHLGRCLTVSTMYSFCCALYTYKEENSVDDKWSKSGANGFSEAYFLPIQMPTDVRGEYKMDLTGLIYQDSDIRFNDLIL